jgi:hypothetical protein
MTSNVESIGGSGRWKKKVGKDKKRAGKRRTRGEREQTGEVKRPRLCYKDAKWIP